MNRCVSSAASACTRYPSPIPHTASGVALVDRRAELVHRGLHGRQRVVARREADHRPVRRAAGDRRPAGRGGADRHVRLLQRERDSCACTSGRCRSRAGHVAAEAALQLRRRVPIRDPVEEPRRIAPPPAAQVQLGQPLERLLRHRPRRIGEDGLGPLPGRRPSGRRPPGRGSASGLLARVVVMPRRPPPIRGAARWLSDTLPSPVQNLHRFRRSRRRPVQVCCVR